MAVSISRINLITNIHQKLGGIGVMVQINLANVEHVHQNWEMVVSLDAIQIQKNIIVVHLMAFVAREMTFVNAQGARIINIEKSVFMFRIQHLP